MDGVVCGQQDGSGTKPMDGPSSTIQREGTGCSVGTQILGVDGALVDPAC